MDAEKMTPGKFRAEFDQQFVAFMKPMDLSPENLAQFKPAVDQFVDDFNGKHAGSGFRIEQAYPDMNCEWRFFGNIFQIFSWIKSKSYIIRFATSTAIDWARELENPIIGHKVMARNVKFSNFPDLHSVFWP